MATAAQRLVQAQNALHALRIGNSAVEVRDSDGSMIRFTAANESRLRQYIEELNAEISGTTVTTRRAAIKPVFG